MKTIKDILTEEEILKYQEGWRNFEGKYKVLSPSEVHNGLPVLSKIFHFRNFGKADKYDLFRAHILYRRLRKFDPYFMASEFLAPFLNPAHRCIVLDQMYQATSICVKGKEEYSKRAAVEATKDAEWNKPIYFNSHTSIEAIRRRLKLKNIKGYDEQEIFYFTFYLDSSGEAISSSTMFLFLRPRSYILDINKIKQGNNSAVDNLVRRIEEQDRRHRRLLKPRTTLKYTKKELIEKIKSGQIPEEELHDFFSLWDKE